MTLLAIAACGLPNTPSAVCGEPSTSATTPAPRYFGYYGDAFTWLTSATDDVAGHVNLSWVGSDYLRTLRGLVSNLERAHRDGLQVALAIPEEVFFAADMTITPNYAANWKYVADRIRPCMAHVAFLYPVDEPYSVSKTIGKNAVDVKARLEFVASVIKTTFPAVPLAFTFSAIDFDIRESAFADLSSPLPAQYDLFGFDCYGSWDSCGDPSYRAVHPIPWYVTEIEKKMNGRQRIILFADAFIREAKPADPRADSAMAALLLDRADQYHQLVLSDSLIGGLFAFLYQDDYVDEQEQRRFLGVKHWPALQAKYMAIGRSLTGK